MVDDSYDEEAGYESEDDFLDDVERREDADAQWVCQLGKDCLVANPFHHRDECFDVDMARALFDDKPCEPSPPEPPEPPEPTDPGDDMSLS